MQGIGVALLISGILFGCALESTDDDSIASATQEQTNKAAQVLNAFYTAELATLQTTSALQARGDGIRTAYQHFLAAKASAKKSIDDPTGSAACASLNVCDENAEVASASGASVTCSTACLNQATGTAPLFVCQIQETFSQSCTEGTQFAIGTNSVVRYSSSCTETSEGVYAAEIAGAYEVRVTSLDGALDSTPLNCSWKFDVTLEETSTIASVLGEGSDLVVGQCSGFTCTIDGATLDCNDIKQALNEQTCTSESN